MRLWDYSHSVALLLYLLDFGTDQRVWHYLVFYWALELLSECDITGFSMGLLNCSDSVPLFVLLLDFGTVPRVWHYWFFIFLLDFGTVPTMWHYLFLYGTLELFRRCGILCFDMGLRNCSDRVALLGFHFSIGLWNCSDSVALLIFIWDFETVPTVWHYLFFLLAFGTVLTV